MNSPTQLQLNRDLVIRVEEASTRLKAELLWNELPKKPKVAIVLGSGLGIFADRLKNTRVVPYKKIPHMKESAVPGHAGQWVCGTASHGQSLLVAQGRVHGYEGHSLAAVTLHIRMMKALGIEHVILTAATGSVNPEYKPGDFVLLDDHINLMFQTPLTGIFDEALGPRFVDLSEPYSLATNQALVTRVKNVKPTLRLHRGVYAALPGPQYETPAEIRMVHRLGGDVVGMSTVPETIVAKQCGLKVTGMACVTNFGSGLSPGGLNHEEVTATAKLVATDFCWLIEELVKLL